MHVLVFASDRGGSGVAAGWMAGCCVCTRMFFYVLGDGGGSFCRNSSLQRFPTLLFSTDIPLCSCVSSHVVISAPF